MTPGLYRLKTSSVICILLVAFTVLCRCSVSVADIYATKVYPLLSAILSFVSSVSSLPFQSIAVLLLVFTSITNVISGCRKRLGCKGVLIQELKLLAWTYVWFYMAWCNNYSRSSIYQRANTEMIDYDQVKFCTFAHEFIDELNDTWTQDSVIDNIELETEVKAFYKRYGCKYGLASPQPWQHPKWMDLPQFYSAVGVTGFMAPLFAESFLNSNLPAYDYPFVYAHELSHLLGVTNEAEANWWAFHVCSSSANKAVRYSGYKGILPYLLSNLHGVLPKDEYDSLFASIRPEVIEDLVETKKLWMSLRSPVLDKVQGSLYDAFLRSNNIPSGRRNYSEVIQMLISIEYKE